MREIKFRAWDPEEKEYFFCDSIFFKGCYSSSFNEFKENEGCIIGPDDYGNREILNYSTILEQYTGLKDKNGKEIYEGDIVKMKSWTTSYNCEKCGYKKVSSKNFLVEWQDLESNDHYSRSVARFAIKKNKWDDGYTFEDSESYEIIGNIHENPELLEKD